MLWVGKHANHRFEEMGRALCVAPEALVSLLLENMVRRLKKQPDILPWVSKLFLEIGEPPVHPIHADLKHEVYFTLIGHAHDRRLAVSDLASRLLAVGLPFWDYQPAIGLTGRAQQEELKRGIRIDLALEFAQL